MPSEERFEVVRRLLESNGWTLERIRGSHHIFHKPGHGMFPVPVHRGKVKGAYVRKIEKIIRPQEG